MIASRKTVLWFLGGAALLIGLYLTLDKLKDTLEAQLADRLTQAVDQLRDRNLEVRLGGIYALERLARTSESEYWPIMEILTTFVRERTSVTKNQPLKEPPLRLAPDIQATLDVIARRRHTYRDGESQRFVSKKPTWLGSAWRRRFSGRLTSRIRTLQTRRCKAPSF